MGIYSTGYVAYGVPVEAFDEEGEPTQFWSEENDDWSEFEDLSALPFGSYDEYPGRAILGPKQSDVFSGDCWEPGKVTIYNEDAQAELFYELEQACQKHNLDVDLSRAGWWVVVSIG
jgi:hypothetical protein